MMSRFQATMADGKLCAVDYVAVLALWSTTAAVLLLNYCTFIAHKHGVSFQHTTI